MPPQEQAELWMQLRDRMKVDWREMTMQEKKAGMLDISSSHSWACVTEIQRLFLESYALNPFALFGREEFNADKIYFTAWWIAFGPHGPRAETPPGEWTKVFIYSGIGLAISAAVFVFIHSFARPQPRSMTKEWQEATNEYLKVSHMHHQYYVSRPVKQELY